MWAAATFVSLLNETGGKGENRGCKPRKFGYDVTIRASFSTDCESLKVTPTGEVPSFFGGKSRVRDTTLLAARVFLAGNKNRLNNFERERVFLSEMIVPEKGGFSF